MKHLKTQKIPTNKNNDLNKIKKTYFLISMIPFTFYMIGYYTNTTPIMALVLGIQTFLLFFSFFNFISKDWFDGNLQMIKNNTVSKKAMTQLTIWELLTPHFVELFGYYIFEQWEMVILISLTIIVAFFGYKKMKKALADIKEIR